MQSEDRAKYRRRQVWGLFLGVSLGMMLAAVVPAIREQFSPVWVIILGGAIGSGLASLEQFERAGAALTKSENRVLNFAIGLGIPLGLLLMLFWFFFN